MNADERGLVLLEPLPSLDIRGIPTSAVGHAFNGIPPALLCYAKPHRFHCLR